MNQLRITNLVIGFLLILLPTVLFLTYWPAGVYHHDSIKVIQAVEEFKGRGILTGQIFGRYGSVLAAIAGATFVDQLGLCHQAICFSTAEMGTISSGVFGAVLIPLLMYLLLRRLGFLLIPASTASLLLAASPGLLLPSGIGKEQSLSCFFLLLAVYLIIATKRSRSTVWLFIGSILAFVFAVSMHESALIYLPFFGLVYGLSQKRWVYSFVLWCLCSLVSSELLLGWYLIPYLSRAVYRPLPYGNVTTQLFGAFPEIIIDCATLLTPIGIALVAIGFFSIIREPGKPRVLLLVPLCSLLCASCLHPYRFRYIMFAFVMLFPFIASGIELLFKRQRTLGIAFVAVGLVLELFISGPILKARANGNGVSIRAWALAQSNLPEGVILACDYQSFLNYYGKRQTWELCASQDVAKLASRKQDETSLYLTSSALNYDRRGSIRSELERQFDFKVVSDISHASANGDGIEIASYSDPIWVLLPRFSHL